MKWKAKEPIKIGSRRIVKRFLFFPITEWIPKRNILIRGATCWLETVYIVQQRIEGYGGELGGCSDFWSNRAFTTKEEYLKYKNNT